MAEKRANKKPKDIKTDESEFDQKIIDLARVTRVMRGGKRMRFRACIALGDKKGRVAIATAKGADVTLAITKAVTKAKRNFSRIQLVNGTIAHGVIKKFRAAKVLIKPAPQGTGIKAGGVMRSILELVGISDIVGKILGSKNKINIARATIEALNSLKKVSLPEQKKTINEQIVVIDSSEANQEQAKKSNILNKD
jgi:small subunit ribosomal protein S5